MLVRSEYFYNLIKYDTHNIPDLFKTRHVTKEFLSEFSLSKYD